VTDGNDAVVPTALRAFVDENPRAVVVIDQEGQLRYGNDAAADILAGGDALVGRPADDLLAPAASGADRADLLAALEDADEGGALSLRTAGGGNAGTRLSATVRAVDAGWLLSFRRDGDCGAGAASTAANVFRQALDTAADGIAILDADGRYHYVNPAHAELYGYDDPGALVGRHWHELYEDAVAERLAADAAPVFEDGGEWRGEPVARRRDGESFPQELALSALPNGDVVCIVRDRTEQTRHERTLRTLREATDGLLSATDRERAAEVAVEAAERALDLPLSAVHLANEDGARLEPVAYTDGVAATFDDIPAFDGDRGSLAWRAFTTGEAQRYDDPGTAQGVYNPDSTAAAELVLPLGEHGTMITGHLGDSEFNEESVRLAHTLASSLTATLDRVAATEQLQETNDRLERLSAVLSHDLRDPLNTAMATTTLARAEADGDIVERLDDLESIHTRMETLIQGVLALTQGLSDIESAPVSLTEAGHEAWRTARTAGDASGATLSVEADGVVTADGAHLQRLLENLFGNAVHHAGPEVSVTFGTTADGFYVADDGPGIPPEQRERVFERGVTGGNGTGLGLDIVSEVAGAHGWTVDVGESDAGGARFDVTGVEWVEPPSD
jgi:PAS domain S-box-containing protein